jgi:hypothetical protein
VIGSNVFIIEKHTRYHDGDSFLVYNQMMTNLVDEARSIRIEIIGDSATIYLDGQPVASTFIDASDIKHSGRIGLLKPWFSAGGVFSEIRVSTPVQ